MAVLSEVPFLLDGKPLGVVNNKAETLSFECKIIQLLSVTAIELSFDVLKITFLKNEIGIFIVWILFVQRILNFTLK